MTKTSWFAGKDTDTDKNRDTGTDKDTDMDVYMHRDMVTDTDMDAIMANDNKSTSQLVLQSLCTYQTALMSFLAPSKWCYRFEHKLV